MKLTIKSQESLDRFINAITGSQKNRGCDYNALVGIEHDTFEQRHLFHIFGDVTEVEVDIIEEGSVTRIKQNTKVVFDVVPVDSISFKLTPKSHE